MESHSKCFTKRNALLLIILFAIVIFSVQSLSAPKTYPKFSGKLVNDFAEMLSKEDLIEDLLLKLEKSTGAQFAVVTVVNMSGESIEKYAEGLFQEWGIGQKGKDNGLLLIIAKEEHDMRIEVGYGLEPYIPDSFAGNLIDSILVPRFSNGEFDRGVIECINAIAEKLNADIGEIPDVSKDENELGYIDLLIILAVIILFIAYSRDNNDKNRGVRGPRTPLPPRGGGGSFPSGGSKGGSGGFGGFGGGRSGGGGASGKW